MGPSLGENFEPWRVVVGGLLAPRLAFAAARVISCERRVPEPRERSGLDGRVGTGRDG
jgi:hypothetical protein